MNLEHKQTETIEHGVEIGAVSKRGGGSTAGIRGHRKLRACVCTTMPTGCKFSTRWESISQRERRTWKEAYQRTTEILHLELLDLVPRFFFFFFFPSSVSASWEIQSRGAAKNQTKNLWLKKRDCYGFYFRIDFFQVRHKKTKLHNPGAIKFYRNEWECWKGKLCLC